MTCTNSTLDFLDEEPPYVLDYFWAAFVVMLYTRTAFVTLTWVFIFTTLHEVLHVAERWFSVDLTALHTETPADALLVSYPILSLLGVLLGLWVVVNAKSPVFLEPYITSRPSPRHIELGRTSWLILQVKYSFQLALVAYAPSYISFDVLGSLLGADAKVELLGVWGAVHLTLIVSYWVWNAPGVDLIWKDTTQQYDRFFVWLAVFFLAFWLPVIALAQTGIFSHFRALIGAAVLAAILWCTLPIRTGSRSVSSVATV